MIQNLFAGMQDALFFGDQFTRGEFTAFMQPGQFVSTALSQDDASPDMYTISELANPVMDTSYVLPADEVTQNDTKFVYRELLGSVDQVYGDVLEKAALPYQALTAEQVRDIRLLRDWLMETEQAYTLYQNRYSDAVKAFEMEAHSQAPSSARLQRLARERDQAARNWDTFGRRPIYEAKYGRYLYLTSPDPQTVWADLQRQYAAHSRVTTAGQAYKQTFLSPSPQQWSAAGTSWSHFERQISDSETYDYSRQTSWSGGVRAGWGLWSFGGGASGSTNLERTQSEVSTVHLSFDYLRVRIQRPWMKSDVFGYRFWTWKNTFGGTLLSDGGNLFATPPIRPVGRMPVLPQYLIVVKNVTLSAAFSRQERELFEKTVRYRASGGWGPFSVSGSYTELTRSLHTQASFDGTTFRIEHPQIIAKTGILLPRSPNPEPSLPWQDDAWKVEDLTAHQFRAASKLRRGDVEKWAEIEQIEQIRAEAEEMRRRHLEQGLRTLNSSRVSARAKLEPKEELV